MVGLFCAIFLPSVSPFCTIVSRHKAAQNPAHLAHGKHRLTLGCGPWSQLGRRSPTYSGGDWFAGESGGRTKASCDGQEGISVLIFDSPTYKKDSHQKCT